MHRDIPGKAFGFSRKNKTMDPRLERQRACGAMKISFETALHKSQSASTPSSCTLALLTSSSSKLVSLHEQRKHFPSQPPQLLRCHWTIGYSLDSSAILFYLICFLKSLPPFTPRHLQTEEKGESPSPETS